MTKSVPGRAPGRVPFHPDFRRLLTWGPRPETASLRVVDPMGPARPPFRSLGVAIHHAAVSPDGGTPPLDRRGGEARLGDVARHVEADSPLRPRPAYPITAAAFDPRSPRAVTGCHAGPARPRDRPSGGLLHDVRGNAGKVTAVAFGPDGRTLVTASRDATARSWDGESGHQLGPPLHHTDTVLCLAFHPDGRVVASGTRDGSACPWHGPGTAMGDDLARIERIVAERTGLRSDER